MKAQFILLGAAIAAGLLLTVMGTMSVANIAAQTGDGTSQGQGKGNMTMAGGSEDSEKPSFVYKLNKKNHDYENGVFKVRVGTGGPLTHITRVFANHSENTGIETFAYLHASHWWEQ